MKNFTTKKIFISLIIFYIIFPTVIHAGDIVGFVKKDAEVFQFSDFISSDIKNQFSIQYKSRGNEEIKVTYYGPNNFKKVFPSIKLTKDELFSFPEEGKFITFQDIGLHKIIIESSKDVSKLINIQVTDNNLYKKLFFNSERNLSKKKKDKIKIANHSIFGERLIAHKYKKVSIRGNSTVYDFVSDSVVFISGTEKNEKGEEVTGYGAGVAISEKHILTNVHVLKGLKDLALATKPKNISHENVSNGEWYRFKVIAEDSKLDLALLEVVDPKFSLPAVNLAKQSNITIGQKVHAIGHPAGLYWSYTDGIISQIRLQHKWSYSEDWLLQADVIQTQVPINPGNSGGPLLDNNHNLVGINSMGYDEFDNLNFAVSISSVKEFLKKAKVKYDNSNFKKKIKKDADFISDDCVVTHTTDLDNNGIVERVDLDCLYGDGVADTIHLDRDGNKKVDIKFTDEDQNSWVDYSIEVKKVENKEWFIHKVYSNNKKNKIIKIGYDYDQDGIIDKIQIVS